MWSVNNLNHSQFSIKHIHTPSTHRQAQNSQRPDIENNRFPIRIIIVHHATVAVVVVVVVVYRRYQRRRRGGGVVWSTQATSDLRSGDGVQFFNYCVIHRDIFQDMWIITNDRTCVLTDFRCGVCLSATSFLNTSFCRLILKIR